MGALSVCLSVGACVLSVCNVGILWSHGWMDQNETWHGGRPRPWPHCVRWGPSSLSPQGHSPPPQFSTHICCGQTAGLIKMPLGTNVDLGPSNIVFDADPAPHPRGRAPIFLSMSVVAKRLDGSRCHLVQRARPRPHSVTWGFNSSHKGHDRLIFGPCLLWPNGRQYLSYC